MGGGRSLELRPFKGLGDQSPPWAGPGEGAFARENTVNQYEKKHAVNIV